MEFRVIERHEFEQANELKSDFSEMLNRKCSACYAENWMLHVTHDDNDSFKYLYGLSREDGYALVCRECFNNRFNQYTWQFKSLLY